MASNKITKKDLNEMAVRSMAEQCCFSFERMQAVGFCYGMTKCFRKIHGDNNEEMAAALKNNLDFINTEPHMAAILQGLIVSMEEAGQDRTMIHSLKTGLFGPLAGLGDAIWWYTAMPIIASICCSLATQNNVLGPIFYILFWALTAIFSRIWFVRLGYNAGVNSIKFIGDNAAYISKAAGILGVMVVGGLIPSYVSFAFPETLVISSVSVQGIFDSIMPNILPLGFVFLLYWLFKKKNVNTMKLILFSMNFFGVMQPACGVMALEVHPLHKKKGAALYMIRYAERYARENGALLTMLLPFNIGFYRRMGYGFGGKLYEYHLPTGALPRLDGEVRAHLRLLQPEEFDQAMDCQRRFAARNHGMVEKFDEELRGARGDIQVRRMGYYDGGRLLGYAAYRLESASACNYTQNRLSVEELVYENGTVLRALLGGLRMQEDLAQTVILRTGEEDFHHLLDDPQDVSGNYIDYGFLQTNVSAVGTMFKLTDGADFVRRTGYRNFPAGTLTAAFRYRDEMADREEELRIGFADGRWAVAEGTADVTVICRQGDLAALLMGSCGLTALLRLGAASADDAEKAWQLAQLLYCVQKPWLNADY